jgi:two-component system, sensor histidine kinase
VLIADDNKDAAESLGMLLRSMGHDTRIAYDGAAALEHADTFRPDVLILDLDMPGIDGYQVSRTVAKLPWATGTLLIALSGWAQTVDRTRGQGAAFHHRLVKPVSAEALQSILGQAEGPAELAEDAAGVKPR